MLQIGQVFRNEVPNPSLIAAFLCMNAKLVSDSTSLSSSGGRRVKRGGAEGITAQKQGIRISPRQGLLRVREFTLGKIEHFVDPEDKPHPKFSEVENLEFLMFPRQNQVSGKSARILRIGEADSEVGVPAVLANEMAHYATDCWDAEIECSCGYIECVGIADRSEYDLRAHTEKSGVPLVSAEKFAEPREVEKLVITPVKKELGLAFKANQKMMVEALEAMGEKEAMDMKVTLESKGVHVCTLGKVVTIKKNMVTISKEKKKEHQRVFTPSVIEPSFGMSIGKQYVRTDELGVPLAITVDSTTTVTPGGRQQATDSCQCRGGGDCS
ncbi:glycyl-tRNA synthetase [Actinidia rufa]|uniref:Glycyl-tRNA synthetase n=1 Tax=Actinidia rufa TaxID=165716 RepID=A0A7J0GB65_9ERIC|nr:glycyl-tRNA synthetase [Actinidia rufa]